MLTETKIKHITNVARLCYTIAKDKYNTTEDFARAMWTLGWNHDIGYEFIDKTDLESDHAELSNDMVFGAFYGFNNAIKTHGKRVTQEDLALKILNEADLKVNSKGIIVTVEERLEDIKKRYGVNSKQYLSAKWIAEELSLI